MGATYHTVCVRTCDGFYIPMSFATTRENFYQDQAKCRATCGGEARLFVYRTPGSEMADAVDMSGTPYSRLPNAFRFRKAVVAGCACRPPPWSETELARHRSYASAAMGARGPASADAVVAAVAGPLSQPDAAPFALEIAHGPVAGTRADESKMTMYRALARRVIARQDTVDATVRAGSKRGRPAIKKPARSQPPVFATLSSKVARPGVRTRGAQTPSPSSGLAVFANALGMGQGARRKYTWPGDRPVQN